MGPVARATSEAMCFDFRDWFKLPNQVRLY